MLALSFKLFFRKKVTVAAVFALALLVAIIASMYATMNCVGSQTRVLGQLERVGDRYLVLNASNSLGESSINSELFENLRFFSDIDELYGQKIFNGTLKTASGNYPVVLRGIENLPEYFKKASVSINGTIAQNDHEVNAGLLLANIASLEKNQQICFSVGEVAFNVKVVGITRTQTQLDTELIVPLQTAHNLTGKTDLSFAEFYFKENANIDTALDHLYQFITDAKIVKVQQTTAFLEQSTNETLNFMAVWSITVYILISTASYVVSTRLMVESEFELATLNAIGAKRFQISFVIFTYVMFIAVVGSILGSSLGIVTTQVASSALRFSQNVLVTPFLELPQFGQIVALSLIFSMLGCLYPAFKKQSYPEL